MRGQSPVSPIWACARNARTTFCDTKAEIGESVDPVIHIERRSGRLILPEVLGIVDTRPTQEKRSDLFGLRGATCGKLRTEKKTNIVANLLSDSTWNPDDFWLGISAPNAVRSSRAIPSRQHPSEYTYSEHDWTWVLHELVHGNGVTEEAHRRAGVHAFCACGEGVIPRPILWWCQNGASHRKNFDTPPLLGSCKCTAVHLERFQRHNNFRCTWVHLGIRGGYGNFERQEKRAL